MEDIYYPSADGVHTIHACIWRPEGSVCGILQIIHGMEEYGARYSSFAEEAARRGFLVCAEDHLGHGQTTAKEERGHFPKDGAELVLSDIYALSLRVREYAPKVPFIIMGHSMGSFFCREYIARYGSQCAAAIIMGTGYKDGATLFFARLLTRLVGAVKGRGYKSKLISSLAFGAYNKRFSPAETGYEWLSAEGGNVRRYVADELCGFGFTCGGYAGLFSIMSMACSSAAFRAVPKELPLLIVSGADDPVGDYGKGVKTVCNKYKKAGVKDVSLILYSGARHEILNDFCGAQACEDVLSFMQKHCPNAAE